MYLTANILKNVQNVNSFEYSEQVKLRQGNAATIYLQLADGDQLGSDGRPLRYMAESGATMTITFSSIVASYSVTKTATQPYSNDTSIWSVAINATDRIAQGNMVFSLIEATAGTRTGMIENAIVVQSTNTSYC